MPGSARKKEKIGRVSGGRKEGARQEAKPCEDGKRRDKGHALESAASTPNGCV